MDRIYYKEHLHDEMMSFRSRLEAAPTHLFLSRGSGFQPRKISRIG